MDIPASEPLIPNSAGLERLPAPVLRGLLPSPAAGASPWRVVGAAAVGTSHQKQDLPCQDAQAYRLLPGGALLLALADGAGSARCSQEGAQVAVLAALTALEWAITADAPADPQTWEDVMRGAVLAASLALADLAQERQESLREFAATLTIAAVLDDWLAVAQLGDGVCVAGDPQGALTALTQLQRGEYANETYFLTQPEADEHVQVSITQQPWEALALMSDGLARLALRLPAGEPHLPFFQPLFAFAHAADPTQAPGQLAAFLQSERVCARTDDDKALLLAVRIKK